MNRVLVFIPVGILSIFLSFTSPVSGEDKPYVSAQIFAELGNQCFEIATALAHAWDHGAEATFPDLVESKRYNIPLNREQVFWRLKADPLPVQEAFFYREPHYHFAKIPYHPNMQINGYFQSEKYFCHHKEKICALFQPKKEIVDYLTTKYGHFLKHPNTVALHVRTYQRPGGMDDPNHNKHSLNGRDYVEKALVHFPKDALFLVFSDDIPWCKKHLEGVADNMHYIEGEQHYHDFYLMSLCDHNLISNSSFSWWAAYINQNDDKIVVAPKRWVEPAAKLNTKDVIPSAWIAIE